MCSTLPQLTMMLYVYGCICMECHAIHSTNSSSLSSQIQSHFDTYCSYLLRHVAHNDDDNQVIEKAQSGSSSNKGRKGGKGRKEESNEERAPEYVEFFAPPYLPPVVDATEGTYIYQPHLCLFLTVIADNCSSTSARAIYMMVVFRCCSYRRRDSWARICT